MCAAPTFLGREDAISEVSDLLIGHRLVTLVGPGGVGKTRLAMELTGALRSSFADEILIGELSGTTDEEDIERVVSRQFDVDSIDALLLRTAGRPTLVVLDNCESTLIQAGRLAGDLIDRSDDVTILATSRSPLYAPNERVVALDPLSLPDDDEGRRATLEAPSVRLFLDRAEAAGARWSVDGQDAEVLAKLVRLLDGLPLAIELAAARSRLVTPAELVDLLDRQLDVLRRPGREVGRHHSLRTAIRTSYQPLDAELQGFFRRLAVVSEPFDLELAAAITDHTIIDALDRLTELVDSSLVDVRTNDDGRTEYRLLDSIRAFGREQLDANGEAADAGDRYAEAMADIADGIVLAALDSFTPELLVTIRDRFAHLASAVEWCIAHDETPARAYRLFLPFYGPTGARPQVAELARRVRTAWDENQPFQAEALAVMGTATFLNGEYEAGAALSRQAADHPDGTAMAKLIAFRTLGYMASLQGDVDEAKANLDTATENARVFSEAFTRELLISRTVIVVDPAESPAALELLDEVGREAARNDELVNVVWSAVVAAYHHNLLGDLAGARQSAEAAVAVADRSGMQWSISTAHRTLAGVLVADEGWDAGAGHFRTAVDATLVVGDVEGMAMVLRAAAGAARHCGLADLAAGLWATIPPVRGLPVVRSIFHEHEEQLLAELGAPTPLDGGTSATRARDLLGPPAGAGGDALAPADATHSSPAAGGATASGVGGADIVHFDGCDLDFALRELRRGGERVHVEPQVFDVLAMLVRRRGSVVTKNELLDEVWGDRFVSAAALSSRIAAARKATGDDGKTQRVIRTVHGKGFTFVAETDGVVG